MVAVAALLCVLIHVDGVLDHQVEVLGIPGMHKSKISLYPFCIEEQLLSHDLNLMELNQRMDV